MSFAKEITNIRYNAAESAFEATVAVEDSDAIYTYPVSVVAGLGTDPAWINTAFLHQAQKRHASSAQGMRSRTLPRKAAPKETTMFDRILSGQSSLLDELLARKAA